MKSEITVAIATLHRPDGLLRCLTALLAGDVLPFEIVVIDQSTDTLTQQGLKTAQTQWAKDAPPLIYVRQERRGLSASRNTAIAHARGRIIAFTDDDCVPDAQWVAAIATAFASAPLPDSVSGRVLPLGPEQPGTHAVSGRLSTQGVDYLKGAIPWLAGTGGNLALKREWLENNGGYDERLGAGAPGKGGEDVDLLYRLLQSGARCRYDPRMLIYHERQDSSLRSAKSWGYSFGIGVCCGIWLRRGQLRGGYLFCVRLYHMLRDAVRAWAQRDTMHAQQRWIAARGVCAGLMKGVLMREASQEK